MLLVLSLVFAGISLIVLVVGGVVTLVLSGQTRVRSGPEVGVEIMSDHLGSETESHLIAQRSTFVGKAASVERNATIDFAEAKQGLAAGNCLSMIPALLAVGGFVGLLFLGGLAALVGVPNILIGGAVMLTVLYILLRMAIAFVRA